MSSYGAGVRWTRDGDFAAGHYSRNHELVFDGGRVPGSASSHNVPAAYVDEAAIDPEELFVASLSACHMLWFLDLARRAGLVVETYSDDAQGELASGEDGRLVMSRVTLRPLVTLSVGEAARIADIHHAAHNACFIANSVRSEVVVEPRWAAG